MLKLLFKDLGLALDSAAEESIPMPIVGLVRQLYAQAIAGGRGDDIFLPSRPMRKRFQG